MKSRGKFFGIGVGPGDRELVTVKAVNTLKKIDVLYVPKAKKNMKSTAFKIVESYIPEGILVKERFFPMSFNDEERINAWEEISKEIVEDVRSNIFVGFITLGDPTVYSTYLYLYERIKNEVEVETIPGITSFLNISSSNNFPLVLNRDSLAIVSGTEDVKKLSTIIDLHESIVLMKVYKKVDVIISLIREKGLERNSLMVSNSSMEDEKIWNVGDFSYGKEIPYFTTIIINKNIEIV